MAAKKTPAFRITRNSSPKSIEQHLLSEITKLTLYIDDSKKIKRRMEKDYTDPKLRAALHRVPKYVDACEAIDYGMPKLHYLLAMLYFLDLGNRKLMLQLQDVPKAELDTWLKDKKNCRRTFDQLIQHHLKGVDGRRKFRQRRKEDRDKFRKEQQEARKEDRDKFRKEQQEARKAYRDKQEAEKSQAERVAEAQRTGAYRAASSSP